MILLDIGLPRLSGYEVCRRIRSASPGGSPVIIALTGYSQDADKARSKAAGFNFHLAKPVDPALLQLMLSSLLTVPE